MTMTKNKPNAAIQHQDQLNQEILVGSTVVFSRAYSNSLQIGTVVKITRRRVRIAYCYKWISNQTNEQRISEWQYLAPPERVLVLTDSLGVELMMLKLRGLLP